ncbi:acyl-CoA carboxylase epsilon subunit [Paenarthrobacter sp. DKR-5]|uniref:acyl-CoA carboxylase epsilon subunit n=1 Tax=Paenarthrobacter sp. DKR-5 TaxID=2835535 RepID=UPI0035B0A7A1
MSAAAELPAAADGNTRAAAGTTPDPALFSVVKGNPAEEELAALAAVVLSLAAEEEGAPAPASSRHWVRRRQLRLAPVPGPGAWRRGLY